MTTTNNVLAAFDKAIAKELPRVSHIPYDSHDICRHFACEVRKRLVAQIEHESAALQSVREHVAKQMEGVHAVLDKAPPKPDNIKTQWAKWFPTDVLGNPMREVPGKPGSYEVAKWPSEESAPEPVADRAASFSDAIEIVKANLDMPKPVRAKDMAAAAAKEHFREFNALVKQPEPVALTDEQIDALVPEGWAHRGALYEIARRLEKAMRVASQPAPVEAQAAPVVTDEMVGRFLGWRLPDNFSPDCLVSFDKEFAKASGSWPRGTNLLDADQAKAMLQHVLGATQEAQAVPEGWLPTADNVNALPPPVRAYIHALEANADPSGTVRDNMIKADTIRALEASNRRIRDELDTPGNREPAARYAGYTGVPCSTSYSEDQRLAWQEGRAAAPTPSKGEA